MERGVAEPAFVAVPAAEHRDVFCFFLDLEKSEKTVVYIICVVASVLDSSRRTRAAATTEVMTA